jgi:hypothetical protein
MYYRKVDNWYCFDLYFGIAKIGTYRTYLQLHFVRGVIPRWPCSARRSWEPRSHPHILSTAYDVLNIKLVK